MTSQKQTNLQECIRWDDEKSDCCPRISFSRRTIELRLQHQFTPFMCSSSCLRLHTII